MSRRARGARAALALLVAGAAASWPALAGARGGARTASRAKTSVAAKATSAERARTKRDRAAAPAAPASAPAAPAAPGAAASATEPSAARAAAPAKARSTLVLPRPSPWTLLGSRILRAPPVDALPVCLPDDVGPDVAMVVKHARATDAHAALAKLGPLIAQEDAGETGAVFVAHVLEARAADGAELEAAWETLGDVAARETRAGRRFCALLERARVALRREHFPEAAAEAVRAARLRGELPDPVAAGEVADFLRAEALHASGRTGEARAIFERLVRAGEPRIALASRLRTTDARFDVDGPAFARADYDALLPQLGSIGISAAGWALRSAESALAFGDADTAVRQLELSLTGVPEPERASAARLRIGDALAAKGELQTARTRWGALAEEQPETPFGRFARLRLEATSDSATAPRGRIERIDRILDGAPEPLVAWGRVLRGRAWLEAGELDRALDDLARLARETVPEEIAPLLADALATTTRAVAAESARHAGCPELVRRLGVLAPSLVPRVSDPDPLLRLARCYEELGLGPGAGALYGAIARSFGPDLVALGRARTALAAGDRTGARRALESLPKTASVDAAELDAVRAALELADGDAPAAAERLASLLERRASEHAPTDMALVVQFARALAQSPAPNRSWVLRLALALEGLPPATRTAERERFGEAAYLSARLLLSLDRRGPALRLLQAAVAALPPGALRSEANLRLGELLPRDDDADAALAQAAQENGGGWSRLAAVVRRTADVRATLGMERRPGALTPDVASAPLATGSDEESGASAAAGAGAAGESFAERASPAGAPGPVPASAPAEAAQEPLPLGTPAAERAR